MLFYFPTESSRGNVFTFLLVGGVLLAQSDQARAGMALDIFGGMRQSVAESTDAETGIKKEYDITGSDMGMILAYKPILLPFQIGAYVSSFSYKSDDMYKDSAATYADSIGASVKGRITGMTYGPHVRAWLPLGWFQPFAEAGYLFGDQKEKVTYDASTTAASYRSELETAYQASAALLGLGFRFSPIPFFGIALGYEMHLGNRSLKSAKLKQTIASGATSTEENSDLDLSSEDKKAKKFNSSAFRVGFTFGF